jgi:Cell division protein
MRVLASLLASWRHGGRPLAVLLLCAVAALAQAQSADNSDAAPPDRVARLSYIAGDLGFLPAGSQDWASADLNRPLTTGDRLSSGDGARAELELGGGVLRMAGGTDFGLLNLNDNLAQVELTQGALNLSVRHLDQGQSYEIDTPTLALVVTSPGTFRVDVDNGGNGTRVTVFNGQATVYGENNAQHDVFQGRSYQFDDASLAALTVSDIGGGDAFDAWSSERDQRYAQSQTRRYVSDDVVGYQDLDQYGSWQSSPDYGAVWYPSQVPVDWAPYRDGHWAYVAPWGWTWVDDSPWGFAPYHYGRWAYIRGAWGWIPGPLVARPVYAPALVAFVGGGGWSVSVGIGGGAPVGWFPLGPGEIYNPWYHCDRDYYRRVNVTNIYVHNTVYRTTVINNINNQYNYYREGRAPQNQRYANRAAPRGFTAVSGTAFAGGHRVQRDLLRVDPRQLAAAPVLARGVTALRPAPRSVAPARGPQARPLPTADFRRNVVARTPPPAALPAAHPNFAPAATRQPQRAATPFANVRVLNSRGAPRPAAAAPDEATRTIPSQSRTMRVPNATPAGRPGPRQVEPAQAGALPSARFAHPQTESRTLPAVEPIRRAQPVEPRQAPQPGTNYVANPRESRPQSSERPANTLPQPPRFERAPAQPAPAERAPAPQEYVRPRQEPPREVAPPRPTYNPPPREYARPTYQQPQPRYEQPQPRYEQPQPRYEQPQPRYEAPRPAAQGQQHAEPARKAPPPRKDEQQH